MRILRWIDACLPAIGWALLAAMLYLLAIVVASKAPAQDEDPHWYWQTYARRQCDVANWPSYCRTVLVRRKVYRHAAVAGWSRENEPWEYRHYYRRHDRDYGDWERRDPRGEHGIKCQWADYVRAIGDKHANPSKALADAEQRWRETVRHLYGEVYMDLDDARDYRKRCTIADTGEGVTGALEKLADRAGADAIGKRCMIVATPCRPGLEHGQEDRR